MTPPRQSDPLAAAIARRALQLRTELANRGDPDDERRIQAGALVELYESGLRADLDRAFRAPVALTIRCAGTRCRGQLLARIYRTAAAPVLVPHIAGVSIRREITNPEGLLRDEWGRGTETVLTRALRARPEHQIDLDCRRCTTRWVQVRAVFAWLDTRTPTVVI